MARFYVVQGHYGQEWEDVAASADRGEALADLRAYRANDPGNPVRLVTRTERERIYVLIEIGSARRIEKSATIPTEATHGDRFIAAIGPFRTMRGARYFQAYGRGNPHILTVADAERMAKTDARFGMSGLGVGDPAGSKAGAARM